MRSPKQTEAKLKLVRLELEEPLHTALRVAAAKAGEPMSQYVKKLVIKNLENKSK